MADILIILTNGFDPDPRTYKEAKHLVQKGHRVEILCWDRENLYRDRPIEQLQGIWIRRFYPAARYGSGFKQLGSFFKFAQKCRRYIRGRKRGNDYYLHCVDLDGMLVGLTCKTPGCRLVFDMREFYESGRFARVKYFIRGMVRHCQRQAYRIIYLNDLQKQFVLERDRAKLVYLPNYCEKEKFVHSEKTPSDTIRVSYIGYVRHEAQLRGLISAAASFPQIEVYIHGKGVKLEKIQQAAASCSNCHVTGFFHHDQAAELYRNTDLLYCVYDIADRNDQYAYPTKFYEAIMTRTPIVMAEKSVAGLFCEEKGIGFTIGEDYAAQMVRIFQRIIAERGLLKAMAERMQLLEQDFSWESIAPNLDEIYK